jgi:hypothetical protein
VGAPDNVPGRAYVYGPASLPVAVEPLEPPATPAALSVPQPNPFREHAALTLRLDRAQAVGAALYDGLGRRVRFLHAGPLPAGEHRLFVAGADLPPGFYVVRVTGEDFALSRRLIRVR